MIVAAIDPGKKVCGVAVFRGGTLAHHALIRVKDSEKLGEAARIEALADRCADALGFFSVSLLIVEGQQVYKGGKENPNDLLPVSLVAGACLIRNQAKKKYLALPRVWTGGVPKETRIAREKQRADRKESLLTREDVLRLEKITPRSLRHNVWDAVLLAQWAYRHRDHF